MIIENTKKELSMRLTVELTKPEQKALKAFIKGYGRLTYASQLSGIERRTIERIAINGRGLNEYIEIIRSKLLEPIGVPQKTEENNRVESEDKRA